MYQTKAFEFSLFNFEGWFDVEGLDVNAILLVVLDGTTMVMSLRLLNWENVLNLAENFRIFSVSSFTGKVQQ